MAGSHAPDSTMRLKSPANADSFRSSASDSSSSQRIPASLGLVPQAAAQLRDGRKGAVKVGAPDVHSHLFCLREQAVLLGRVSHRQVGDCVQESQRHAHFFVGIRGSARGDLESRAVDLRGKVGRAQHGIGALRRLAAVVGRTHGRHRLAAVKNACWSPQNPAARPARKPAARRPDPGRAASARAARLCERRARAGFRAVSGRSGARGAPAPQARAGSL